MLSLGSKLIAASLFPLVLGIVALAQPFLGVWVGPAFAQHSALVMQLLAIGLFINGFSKVAFNLIQAQGRADVTAKLHLIELPVYIGVLVLLTRHAGIVGAAAGWTLRMVLDAGLLYWMSARVAHVQPRVIWNTAALALGATALLCGLLFVHDLTARIVLAAVALVAFGWTFWRWVLNREDRNAVIRVFRPLSRQSDIS
jgi:O-antigen/teichoic acid export membrane protein